MKSPDVISEWLAALEAERHDISYRSAKSNDLSVTEPKPKQKRANARVVVETYKRPTSSELTPEQLRAQAKRDEMVYNAGRYAAGARDTKAIEAFQKLARGDK